MRPTYENVYIGSFIFTLGYMFSAKANGGLVSAAIELYQQTRDGEKTIGDLLTSIGGKSIIVEFKRNRTGIKDEVEKESKKLLRSALVATGKVPDFDVNRFQDVSERCHFFSIADQNPDHGANCLHFKSYRGLLVKTPTNQHWLTDQDFCANYLRDGDYRYGVDQGDFKYYVGELSRITQGTCGGLAISINKDGIVSSVVFDDIKQLDMSLKKVEMDAEARITALEPSSYELGGRGPR